MSDNPTTIILKQPPTFREYLILAVVLVLAILFIRSCHGSDTLRTAAMQKEDSLKALNTTLQASHTADSLEKTALIGEVRELRVKAQSSKDSDLMAFTGLQKAYRGLSGRIQASEPSKPDSNGVWVVPEKYLKQCDSCATALQLGSSAFDKLKYDDSATKALYEYELALREAYEKDLNRQYDSSQSLFNAQSQVVTALAKAGKPKAQIFAGVEILGGPVTVFQNIGGALSLKTKQDKLFQISGGLTNLGTWYARINANFKIHF